jgi:hypothetical protein
MLTADIKRLIQCVRRGVREWLLLAIFVAIWVELSPQPFAPEGLQDFK